MRKLRHGQIVDFHLVAAGKVRDPVSARLEHLDETAVLEEQTALVLRNDDALDAKHCTSP